MPGEARAEGGATLDPRSFDVFANPLSGRKMNSLGFDVPAFYMKAQRRFVAILVEVGDAQLAAGRTARAGIKIELQYGPVTQFQNRISGPASR